MDCKIGVIGRFGGPENMVDGQTVKTKNLGMLLEEKCGISVIKADTYYFRKNNVKLLLDTLRCMVVCRHVFLMVSVNGMNFYLRFLYYLNKLTRKHIYHYIIGSELLDMVSKNPKLVKYLNALDANWFEYDSGTAFLRKKGVRNVSTLKNFKLIKPVDEAGPYHRTDGIFHFCTFSRVMEEKGITEAIETVARVNADAGKTVAALDIYGPIDGKYEGSFERLLQDHRDCVSYKGVVNSTDSVAVLKDYYALLFPTRWPGEGVPGTLIDAFAAGIPVIASDWNANREVIAHGCQGLLYPNEEMKDLREAVVWATKHEAYFQQLRTQSRAEFENYTPDAILNAILAQLRSREGKDR